MSGRHLTSSDLAPAERPRRRSPRTVVKFVAALAMVGLVTAAMLPTAAAAPQAEQWSLDQLAMEFIQRDVRGDGVIVAVVDTAIAAGHSDLQGQLVDGWDAIEDQPYRIDDPRRATAAVEHGTMVAGIVVASADAAGVTGVAPGAKVMPIRAVPDEGRGDTGVLADGIRWAVDNGADVINISIRSRTNSARVRAAVDHAAANGVIVVSSAGRGPETGPFYPAALDSVIAVGAVDSSLTRHVDSPITTAVELAAPGADIVTTSGTTPDGLVRGWGTSFAAPHVSGVIAIMRQVAPSASLIEIREALHATAVDLGAPGRDGEYGHGLIDAVGALMWIDRRPPEPPAASRVVVGAGVISVQWDASASFDVLSYEVLVDGRLAAVVPRESLTATVAAPAVGAGRIEVRAVDASGRRASSDPADAGVGTPAIEGAPLALVTSSGRAVGLDTSVPFARVDDAVAAAGDVSGYWLVAANGAVVPRGDVVHLGDASGLEIDAPIVDIAATPSGLGYWLLGADGGVYAFGDARFVGSIAGLQLAAPAVAMVPSASGGGYWIAAQDGGVFALGDATFSGSASSVTLASPVIDIAAGSDGYWVLGADGGVFAFGSPFLGRLAASSSALVAADGGYQVVDAVGVIRGFGPAPDRGAVQLLPGERVVGVLDAR